MRPAGGDGPVPEDWRSSYLKLRSVLADRATGLPAFPMLFDALRTALDGRRRIGVLHVELGDLDLVESLYGWQVFDRVMAEVALALRAAVGSTLPGSTLLALNGVAGDRLVVFVLDAPRRGDVDAAGLARLAERVGKRVEDVLDGPSLAGLSPRPAVRVGHALLSLHPFYRFERRVYASIDEAARSCERRELRRERSWGEELQRIIDDAQVRAFLQPVVRLADREVLGFEALVRGPAQGPFEAPRTMFALSERLGNSADLDRVCLAEALRVTAAGDFRGKLFVNVLPGALAAGNGAAVALERDCDAAGLDRADLVLEFSERWVEGDRAALLAAMRQARERGFGVALDDVGTGPDSRATVAEAGPHYVKLDGSLVRDVDRNLIKQEVLAALVRIAGEVGAEVIAEGVESELEAESLRDAGAALAQGYLFAVPAPAHTALRRAY